MINTPLTCLACHIIAAKKQSTNETEVKKPPKIELLIAKTESVAILKEELRLISKLHHIH